VQQACERRDRRLDRSELAVVELAQPLRQPGRAPRADPAKQPLPLLGQPDGDAAAILLALCALDEPVALEAVDLLRHRRRAHPLAGGELADADPGGVLDADEQRDLAGGGAERACLASELAADLEQDGPEGVGKRDGVGSQQIVNSVNDS
jgi:hypothetical protein